MTNNELILNILFNLGFQYKQHINSKIMFYMDNVNFYNKSSIEQPIYNPQANLIVDFNKDYDNKNNLKTLYLDIKNCLMSFISDNQVKADDFISLKNIKPFLKAKSNANLTDISNLIYQTNTNNQINIDRSKKSLEKIYFLKYKGVDIVDIDYNNCVDQLIFNLNFEKQSIYEHSISLLKSNQMPVDKKVLKNNIDNKNDVFENVINYGKDVKNIPTNKQELDRNFLKEPLTTDLIQ